MDDTERLDWLGDQLWNDWTLSEYGHIEKEGPTEYVLSKEGSDGRSWEISVKAETLRGVIDKAAESTE